MYLLREKRQERLEFRTLCLVQPETLSMTMRAIVGGCMMYGVAADADMPRQLFNVAPSLRGSNAPRHCWNNPR